ncbi:MAG: FG-GAP-like repeat-containing protein [Saprospiraceae bacterium]
MTLRFLLATFFAVCFNTSLFSQYFEDGTRLLPDGGTRFSTMDIRAADLDGDGDMDVVLANEFQSNTILINDGGGVFSFSFGNLPSVDHDSEDVAIADFDQDGDMDLVFCSEDDVTIGSTDVHEYYLNNGFAKFTQAPFHFPDSKSNAVIAADLNGDKWPDLIFGNDGQNSIFINDQKGGFLEETTNRLPQMNDLTQDLNLEDIDKDGDLDLFVGNENGNRLLINDGFGIFTDESLTRLPQGVNMETRKITFADVDLDGDPDVYLSNVSFISGKNRQNRLYLNDGSGRFSDETESRIPAELKHSLDALFLDVNNDGDLDLFVCGINISNSTLTMAPVSAYINDGSGKFTADNEVAFGPDYLVKGLGMFAADFNGDGKTDIYVCDRNDSKTKSKDILLLASKTSAVLNLGNLSDPINLFPNPGESSMTVLFQGVNAINTSFGLYNSAGKLVATPEINRVSRNHFVLDCSSYDLKAGVYWLLIGSGGKQWYKQWKVF